MSQYIASLAIIVREYDETINWYCGILGFHLVENTVLTTCLVSDRQCRRQTSRVPLHRHPSRSPSAARANLSIGQSPAIQNQT